MDNHGCAVDRDNDGVPDYKDDCRNTPPGAEVDASGCVLDSDNDGVIDYHDECPDTPEVVEVDDKGCAVDSDNDGVEDHKDECRNTPEGVSVNARGCWEVEDLQFEVGKSEIRPAYHDNLNEVVSILRHCRGLAFLS